MHFAIELLESRQMLDAELLSDVNALSGSGYNGGGAVLGQNLIFAGNGEVAQDDVWRTDGTAAGTQLVCDLPAGDSGTWYPERFLRAGPYVFFIAGTEHNVLWRTDGTESGTLRLKTFSAGIGIVAAGGKMFVNAGGTPDVPSSLWVSDGSIAGTIQLNVGGAAKMTAFGNSVYYVGPAEEIYKSDGTVAGTVRVTHLAPSGGEANIEDLHAHNDRLMFTVNRGGGYDLWKTDGSSAGTSVIAPISGFYHFGAPISVVSAGSLMIWFGEDSRIWRSDGTASGTFFINASGFSPNNFRDIAAVGSSAYLLIDAGSSTRQIWKTSGTVATTLNQRTFIGSAKPIDLGAVGGQLFIANEGPGTDPSAGALYTGDGTVAGTVQLTPPNTYSQLPILMPDGRMLFAGAQNLTGSEPWITNGTTTGTSMLLQLAPSTASSNPTFITDINGKLFFRGRTQASISASSEPRVFTSDHSASGTVSPVVSNMPFEEGASIAAYNGMAYFASRNASTSAIELWRSDGTTGGTTRIKTIGNGGSGNDPRFFTIANNLLFFNAGTSTTGVELWRSDGTAAGTFMVKDVYPGAISGTGGSAVLNNVIYFLGTDAETGTELWRSDGTTPGTYRVTDLHPGSDNGVYSFFVGGGKLWLNANTPEHGQEIWISDGTSAGTHLVKDVRPGDIGSNPRMRLFWRGRMYFTADAARGPVFDVNEELWATDGTDAGTVQVTEIAGPFDSSRAAGFIALDDYILFTAEENQTGTELYRTDGTLAGTQLVREFVPGDDGGWGLYGQLEAQRLGDGVVFSALDENRQGRMWYSDGSASGTIQIADQPGQGYHTARFNGRLYFYRTSGELPLSRQVEMWSTNGTAIGTRFETLVANEEETSSILATQQPVVSAGRLYFPAHRRASGMEVYRINDTEAPAFAAGNFDFDATNAPQLRLRFTDNVAASLSSSDVQIVDIATNQPLQTPYTLSFDSLTDSATVSFVSQPADGNYRLTIAAGSILDPAGNSLQQPVQFDFFVFAGDANRDRTINISDFAILAARFNMPGVFSQGDFNYDGVANISDFAILAAKFNTSLPAASGFNRSPLASRAADKTVVNPAGLRNIPVNSEAGDDELLFGLSD